MDPAAALAAHMNGHANGNGSGSGSGGGGLLAPGDVLENFSYTGEMGPVMDISTFPPTMAPAPAGMDMSSMMSMDSILSSDFWDSVLVPGGWPLHLPSVIGAVLGGAGS